MTTLGEAKQPSTTAAARGPLEIALAARDCDGVCTASSHQKTCAALTCQARVPAGVRLAIANGEDASRAFADGLTPLCRMAALGERRILKVLIAAKADVDARPARSAAGAKLSAVADQVVEAGFAALHWACREGCTECARLLLVAGADAGLKGEKFGMYGTALSFAESNGHSDVAALLCSPPQMQPADADAVHSSVGRGRVDVADAALLGASTAQPEPEPEYTPPAES